MPIDFYRRRVLTLDGHEDDTITLTTTQDMAKVVARAVDYEGDWPVFGGIVGSNITISQLIALGEKIRTPVFILLVPLLANRYPIQVVLSKLKNSVWMTLKPGSSGPLGFPKSPIQLSLWSSVRVLPELSLRVFYWVSIMVVGRLLTMHGTSYSRILSFLDLGIGWWMLGERLMPVPRAFTLTSKLPVKKFSRPYRCRMIETILYRQLQHQGSTII